MNGNILSSKMVLLLLLFIIVIMLYSTDIKGEARDKEMKFDDMNLH